MAMERNEVDIVVEGQMRRIVGIEVKATATETSSDFAGLRKLEAGSGSGKRGRRWGGWRAQRETTRRPMLAAAPMRNLVMLKSVEDCSSRSLPQLPT